MIVRDGFEFHCIETYTRDPGLCICGHPLGHHTPAAVAHRTCEHNDGCVLFTSERGVVPLRQVSKVRHIEPLTPPTISEQFAQSLELQLYQIACRAQDAIERIYAR